MKKVYYISTCDTCKRIILALDLKNKGFTFQDIKAEKINVSQLEEMRSLSGSYESLFSRTARKYKELDAKKLNETDYKKHILEAYTFLKRPVILIKGSIFIGNSRANLEAAAKAL